jgi:hypothetical protein
MTNTASNARAALCNIDLVPRLKEPIICARAPIATTPSGFPLRPIGGIPEMRTYPGMVALAACRAWHYCCGVCVDMVKRCQSCENNCNTKSKNQNGKDNSRGPLLGLPSPSPPANILSGSMLASIAELAVLSERSQRAVAGVAIGRAGTASAGD